MPAAQAANLTPGTGGISGSLAGAKGETVADLAMAKAFQLGFSFRDQVSGSADLAIPETSP
jgi:hypothetical protein